MTMREFAKHIIATANLNNKKITNLQLQKIMFFSIGMHLRKHKGIDELVKGLYNVPFEKWDYGPVVESVYYEYNHFGKSEIKDDNAKIKEEYNVFNSTILKLLDINVYKMVNVSHQMDSWKNSESKIRNREYVPPYELEDILKDFIADE